MAECHSIYLNMAQSTVRRDYMEALFASLSLPVRRFEAVDGSALTEVQLASCASTRPKARKLARGEVGCFLSHRKIWEAVVAGAANHVAVFEDDIALSDDAAALLRNLDWVPAHVDFIKLDSALKPAMISNLQPVAGSWRQIGQFHSAIDGTAGYILSKHAAHQLLDRTKDMLAPVDVQLFHPFYRTFHPIKCWQLTPAICVQQKMIKGFDFLPSEAEVSGIDDERETIRQGFSQRKPLGFAKIAREINRPFRRWTSPLAERATGWWMNGQMQDIPFRK